MTIREGGGVQNGTGIYSGLGSGWGGLVGVSIGLGGGWDSPSQLLRGSGTVMGFIPGLVGGWSGLVGGARFGLGGALG